MSIILDSQTRVLVQGASSGTARRHIPAMLKYGTTVVGGVAPGHGNGVFEGVPLFDTVASAMAATRPELSVSFVPPTQAADAVFEAIDAGLRKLIVLADGVPVADALLMAVRAADAGALLIGPNSQGVISPGQAKVGGTGGSNPDLLFSRGRVGVISKSGGMGSELCWWLTRSGIGQSTYVAIGGDAIAADRVLAVFDLFEEDGDTDLICYFGEPGGRVEARLAEAIRTERIRKPVIAVIPGDSVETLGRGVSFGHVGALTESQAESASAKREVLEAAGAMVADDWRRAADLVIDRLELSKEESTRTR